MIIRFTCKFDYLQAYAQYNGIPLYKHDIILFQTGQRNNLSTDQTVLYVYNSRRIKKKNRVYIAERFYSCNLFARNSTLKK